MTTNQLPQITLAALASINSAAFSETANLNQAREVAKLVLDSYELSSGEFVNMTWQPNGALFNKLSKMGVDYAQQFVEGLHAIAYSELKRHTKETKRAAACIYWRLVEAAEKHAANEQAAHDAEIAAIAQHPAIAPVVAACAKSRELIIELNTCDKVRFFEIYSEITAAGKLPKLTPYFSMDFQTQEIFNTKKSTDALVTYNNFVKSGFVDAYILTHLFTAVRNAAQRLDLIVETSLYIAGQHQYNESEKTAGYKLLRLFGEYTIGWVLDEPANEPTATANENYAQIAIDLVAELENCNVQRFFEIRNQIQTIGYQFEKSRVIDCFDVANALEAAGVRLGIVVVGDERKPIAGYKKFVVLDVFIGWILDEPTVTTKPRELAELDECLDAQIAAAHAVAVANNGSEFANVENAAAKAGVSLGNYFDLYGDAGWELDFEPMQLEQLQDIYAAAKEQDGDDDDKNSADQLVEQFAKFIHNKIQERHSFFLQKIESIGFQTTAFCYEILLHEQTKISLRVEENGNCHLKHLCAGVGNGSFCSLSFCVYLSQNFEKFFCRKMEAFFRDILRKI